MEEEETVVEVEREVVVMAVATEVEKEGVGKEEVGMVEVKEVGMVEVKVVEAMVEAATARGRGDRGCCS